MKPGATDSDHPERPGHHDHSDRYAASVPPLQRCRPDPGCGRVPPGHGRRPPSYRLASPPRAAPPRHQQLAAQLELTYRGHPAIADPVGPLALDDVSRWGPQFGVAPPTA